MNEWMDGIGPRSKCEIFCTLFWNCVPHISNWEFFAVEHGAFWSDKHSPINQETVTNLQSFLYPMKSPRDNNIPNEYQHVKLLYIFVMKSMIELWEVKAFHCESEPLPSHLLYPYRPIYQKYVCCYCVHTIWVTMTYNYTESPKLPLS